MIFQSNANITNATVSNDEPVTFAVPTSLKIIQQPTNGVKNSVFSPVLKVSSSTCYYALFRHVILDSKAITH